MQIVVIAKTKAKQAKVIKVDEHTYQVAVTAAPVDGKANAAIIKALAKHLGIAPSRLRIKRGLTSKNKFLVLA